MSSQKQSLASLRAEVESLRAEVAAMRADELIGVGFLGRSLAVLGYWVAGLMMVATVVGVASWLVGVL